MMRRSISVSMVFKFVETQPPTQMGKLIESKPGAEYLLSQKELSTFQVVSHLHMGFTIWMEDTLLRLRTLMGN